MIPTPPLIEILEPGDRPIEPCLEASAFIWAALRPL